MDEKYRDYISLAIVFLMLILMITLVFLSKTGMAKNGAGAIGGVVRVLSEVRPIQG